MPLDTQRQRRAEASRAAMAATRFRKQKGTQRTQWTHEHIRTTQTRECYATPPHFSDPTTPNAVEKHKRSSNTKEGPDMGFEPRGGGEEEEESRRGGEEEEGKKRRKSTFWVCFLLLLCLFSSPLAAAEQKAQCEGLCSCPILASSTFNCEQRLRFNLT